MQIWHELVIDVIINIVHIPYVNIDINQFACDILFLRCIIIYIQN